jgi:poly-gamma-glutamate synthase PgsB/CapB
MMANKKLFKKILTEDLSFPWDKLYQSAIDDLVADYDKWKGHNLVYDNDASNNERTANVAFMLQKINDALLKSPKLESTYTEFHRRYSHASDINEQQTHILQFSKDLGADRKQLKKDIKALQRWFNIDAITERYQNIQAESEAQLIFYVSRLSSVVDALWCNDNQQKKLVIFQRYKFDNVLLPLLSHKASERLKVAAFKALGQLLLPIATANISAIPTDISRYIYRFAIDKSQPIWCQVEALQLLSKVGTQYLGDIFDNRLTHITNDSDDDFFFRHHLVLSLGKNTDEKSELLSYIPTLLADPKPYVRIAFINILTELPQHIAINILPQLLTDECEAVVAATTQKIPDLITQHQSAYPYMDSLISLVQGTTSEFISRSALHVIVSSFHQAIKYLNPEKTNKLLQQIESILTEINTCASSVKVRRWAAQTREQLWASMYNASEQLTDLFDLAPEKRKKLTVQQREDLKTSHGKRWLAAKTKDDFGFDIAKNKIVRDSKTGFRLWRFLFEWRTPSTDKRQNYNHTKGRIYFGLEQVPAQNMAEISPTKVPGEPLHIEEEGGWRPYLPLVDQLISSLDQGWPTKPLTIYSSEGVTYVTPPTSFIQRLFAKTQLTLRFDYYANLRNWNSHVEYAPDEYLSSLKKLGFTFTIEAHTDSEGNAYPLDKKVNHFFPMAVMPPFILTWWQQYQSYFFSVYQNTLSQLGMFLMAILASFFALHIKANVQLKHARKSIPLVIGGWGTRGKSGTERLKAALFNALGFSVLSKTTGCEAMFLYGTKGKPLSEMFLFRPYDKATIWEQVNVTRIAKNLKSDVLLWECMGLTPRYIEILQQQWMKDDIATITNCYPDHEDLQGPAGIDIPKVMMKFVPKNSLLITSEENMLPYLRLAAKEQKTEMVSVNWLDAGLITPDIMARFPYQEHPNNVALVLSLAKQMNIDETYALKEMADRVIPDIGVLKSSPEANIHGRKLQFINGMSANERFGTLGNWRRVGLDKQSLTTDTDKWIITVINNREDRVARSKVFADLIVRDISADRHMLIGNNLSGLMGFIKQSWSNFVDSQQLTYTESKTSIQEKLVSITKQLRIPMTIELVALRHQKMCQGLGIEQPNKDYSIQDSYTLHANAEQVNALIEQYKHDLKDQEAFTTLITELSNITEANIKDKQACINLIKNQLWQWFSNKLIQIKDYHATGNQIIQSLALSCPPGLHSQVMGLQNIKGTGLDFVYRWQAWERTHQLCLQLKDNTEEVAREALRELTKIQDFGPLDVEAVIQHLNWAGRHKVFQTELCQAQIEVTRTQLNEQLSNQSLTQANANKSVINTLINATEAFLDAGDAIKRRNKANVIIDDLVNKQISQDMAAHELLKLTQQQKGGWLSKKLQS